jgi:hypothetical protein
MKKYVGMFRPIVLVNVACWATNAVSGLVPLAENMARADSAYRSLPLTLAAYNAAVREICEDMQATGVREFKSSLKNLGISFESPNVRLSLRLIEVPPPLTIVGPSEAGVPVVAGYDTTEAPIYPPEGLFVNATAIYDRLAGRPRFSIRYGTTDVMLKDRTYRLAINPAGAGDHLKLRARQLAKSGFAGMLRPASMSRKPQIYLLDPYDPKKIPILMVHGLQSTPVAFATLVNALPDRGLSQLARMNANAMRPEAAAFFEGGRFSAVRTLSTRSTALIAVSELPIEVPYHSVNSRIY